MIIQLHALSWFVAGTKWGASVVDVCVIKCPVERMFTHVHPHMLHECHASNTVQYIGLGIIMWLTRSHSHVEVEHRPRRYTLSRGEI